MHFAAATPVYAPAGCMPLGVNDDVVECLCSSNAV